MVFRRGGQFDAPGFEQLAVARNDLAHFTPDDAEQLHPVGVRKALCFGDQSGHDVVAASYCLPHPRDVIPAEQIAKVLRRQIGSSGFAVALRHSMERKQPAVCRVGFDQLLMVGPEAGIQNKIALFQVELLKIRLRKQAQQRVAEASAGELIGVVLDLIEQYGREVQHHAHARVRFEMRSHVAVVLDGVQVHPGLHEISAGVIAEIGLVHVPQQNQIQPGIVHRDTRGQR